MNRLLVTIWKTVLDNRRHNKQFLVIPEPLPEDSKAKHA